MAKQPKLTKKERKEQLKQQLEYEKHLVAEGRIPDRRRYQPRGIFWRVFAVCLAFFFGIFTALGALVGGILYFGTKKSVGDILSVFGVNYEQFLTEDYGEMKLLDLVQDITQTKFNNLESIAKYTPILRDSLDKVNEQAAALGVHLNIDELMREDFSTIGTYFQQNVVNGIVLGETLGLAPGNDGQKLMISLCYGTEGEDYEVEDGKFVMKEGKEALTVGAIVNGGVNSLLERMTIEGVLGVTGSSNATMLYLAYGTEGTHFEVKEDGSVEMLVNPYTGEKFKKRTFADFMNDGMTVLDDARISDLVTVDDNADGILGAIRDWKISDLMNSYRIERLGIGALFTVGEDASALAKMISSWRIGDLTSGNKLNTVTLGEILSVDEDSPLILKALKDTSIGELGDCINTLRLSDILGESDLSENQFLKFLGMSTLDSLSDDILGLTAANVFGDELFNYLSLDANSANHGKTYADIVAAFDRTNKDSELPVSIEIASNQRVNTYYMPKEGGTRLTDGYVIDTGSGYIAVDPSLVYKRNAAEGMKYFITGEMRLTANSYTWKQVDYSARELVSLPTGDSISDDTAGYTAEGTSETGLYYLTTRTLADNTTQNVAYAIHEDGSGTYFTRLKYNSETETYSSERVDLERTVSSYTDENGNDYPVQADGTVKNGEENVTVYENKEDGFYFKTETEVFHRYYAAPADNGTEIATVYTEADVVEHYELVEAVSGGTETVVCQLDRYLSDFWYFVLGVDDNGDDADHSDTPLLDIVDFMRKLPERITDTELWKLYLHGMVTSNPYVSLPASLFGSEGVEVSTGKKVTNLNECTVQESIVLIQKLTEKLS